MSQQCPVDIYVSECLVAVYSHVTGRALVPKDGARQIHIVGITRRKKCGNSFESDVALGTEQSKKFGRVHYYLSEGGSVSVYCRMVRFVRNDS